jgi:hypothetical protein
MTTNPSDKAILKAFKNVKDKAAFTACMSKLRTEPVQNAFRLLHDMLGTGGDADVPVEQMEALLKGRMLDATEFVFGKMEPKIAALDLDSVLRIAPTPRCLQLWIGVGRHGPGGGDRLAVVIERFIKSPVSAMDSVLAHWFIAHAPAPLLPESAALFIAKAEACNSTSVEDLLGQALKRDKDGKFTTRLLMESSQQKEAWERNLRLVRGENVLFDDFVLALAFAKKGMPLDILQRTIAELFGNVKVSRAILGRELSRRFVALAETMLSTPIDEHSHIALSEIDRLSAEIESTFCDDDMDRSICGIRYLGRQRERGNARINLEGAKLMAIAISKADESPNPTALFEATAFNLGMRPIEHEATNVTFDPTRHEDVVGGALRGDAVTVIQSGWTLDDALIQRAKVKPI